MVNRISQEEYERRVQEKYNGKYIVISPYINSVSKVTLRCTQCGNELQRIAVSVTQASGNTCCPICDRKLITQNCVIRGVNDLWTTHKEVAALLKNPEDGYKYTAGSNIKVPFICSNCGNERIKMIVEVVRNGLSCPMCGDGVSYPNKLMANLLKANGIDYDTEYYIPGYKFRYDFHFVINDIDYLVEMDGALNHGTIDLPNMSIQDRNDNDLRKNLIAKENGYHLIRIDCRYTESQDRFEYIKNSIISSELSDLLNDLSEDTFNKCDIVALNTSYIKEVADAWNSGVHSSEKLQKLLKLSRNTIRKYLRNASKIGLIKESDDEITNKLCEAGIESRSFKQGQPVMCIETGEVFPTIAATRRAGYPRVDAYLQNQTHYSGMLPDGTKLTWKKITHEEYLRLKSA